eukprot:19331-Heterococcus_DN1.PRE.4
MYTSSAVQLSTVYYYVVASNFTSCLCLNLLSVKHCSVIPLRPSGAVTSVHLKKSVYGQNVCCNSSNSRQKITAHRSITSAELQQSMQGVHKRHIYACNTTFRAPSVLLGLCTTAAYDNCAGP